MCVRVCSKRIQLLFVYLESLSCPYYHCLIAQKFFMCECVCEGACVRVCACSGVRVLSCACVRVCMYVGRGI